MIPRVVVLVLGIERRRIPHTGTCLVPSVGPIFGLVTYLRLVHLLTLLLPHLVQLRAALVAILLPPERVECLYQYLLDAGISAHPQQLLDGLNKLRIEISSECRPGVVRQDPDQHDGIVLYVWLRVVVLGQELSNEIRSFFGRRRGRFAGLDYRW